MVLTIKVFGKISEEIGQMEFSIENPGNVSALIEKLQAQFPQIQELKYAIAINHQLGKSSDDIPDGAEIALLPPFSGG
jgi:sulfur-carrier protein